jgi:hypothetical protein
MNASYLKNTHARTPARQTSWQPLHPIPPQQPFMHPVFPAGLCRPVMVPSACAVTPGGGAASSFALLGSSLTNEKPRPRPVGSPRPTSVRAAGLRTASCTRADWYAWDWAQGVFCRHARSMYTRHSTPQACQSRSCGQPTRAASLQTGNNTWSCGLR